MEFEELFITARTALRGNHTCLTSALLLVCSISVYTFLALTAELAASSGLGKFRKSPSVYNILELREYIPKI